MIKYLQLSPAIRLAFMAASISTRADPVTILETIVLTRDLALKTDTAVMASTLEL